MDRKETDQQPQDRFKKTRKDSKREELEGKNNTKRNDSTVSSLLEMFFQFTMKHTCVSHLHIDILQSFNHSNDVNEKKKR